MSTYTPHLGHRTPIRRAGSLSQVLRWQFDRLWLALERIGEHRAAPEIARAAERLALTDPDLAAHLARVAKRWRDA